jgi:hypothetical protein
VLVRREERADEPHEGLPVRARPAEHDLEALRRLRRR